MPALLRDALLELIVPVMRMQCAYAAALVHDLSEQQMDEDAGPGHENTPRFTLGHLCTASAMTVWALENPGADRSKIRLDLPPGYEEQFRRMGPADRRTPERAASPPTRDELLAELRRLHSRVENALRGVAEDALAAHQEWKLAHHLPRLADIVVFMCTTHEMLHLGQLAAWRRAKALPAAMARMAELRI